MSVASRPDTSGKTRTCPHCKATILESLSVCPGCLHHLRFDQEAAKRQVAAQSALRVDGVISHPPATEPWEYFVVIAVRNDRGEEVTRQVVNVGALHNAEKRSFTLSVEVMPLQSAVPAGKPGTAASTGAAAAASRVPATAVPSAAMRTPGATMKTPGAAIKAPGAGVTAPAAATKVPAAVAKAPGTDARALPGAPAARAAPAPALAPSGAGAPKPAEPGQAGASPAAPGPGARKQ